MGEKLSKTIIDVWPLHRGGIAINHCCLLNPLKGLRNNRYTHSIDFIGCVEE
ncbi:hypothetical protein SK128_027426, partial [Halocaridina rubra]